MWHAPALIPLGPPSGHARGWGCRSRGTGQSGRRGKRRRFSWLSAYCASVVYSRYVYRPRRRSHCQGNEHHPEGDIPADRSRELSRRQRSHARRQISGALPRQSTSCSATKTAWRSVSPASSAPPPVLRTASTSRPRRTLKSVRISQRRALRQGLQHRLQPLHLLRLLRRGVSDRCHHPWPRLRTRHAERHQSGHAQGRPARSYAYASRCCAICERPG